MSALHCHGSILPGRITVDDPSEPEMDRRQQARKAEAFRRLHIAPEILVLPNAWDVASARLFATAGFRAVGTTSMGVAATFGQPDVQVLELDEMLGAIGRIARGLELPVNADLEAGYADDPAGVAANVRRAVEAGAVGVNLEDGTGDADAPLLAPHELADRIAAVREMASAIEVPLVVNARTDVYLRSVGAPEERLGNAIERGNLYRDAGADCVFVPGAAERETLAALVRGIRAPINVLANATTTPRLPPSIAELEALGVARLSVGSAPMKAGLAHTLRVARDLAAGSYAAYQDELAVEAYQLAIGAEPRS